MGEFVDATTVIHVDVPVLVAQVLEVALLVNDCVPVVGIARLAGTEVVVVSTLVIRLGLVGLARVRHLPHLAFSPQAAGLPTCLPETVRFALPRRQRVSRNLQRALQPLTPTGSRGVGAAA